MCQGLWRTRKNRFLLLPELFDDKKFKTAKIYVEQRKFYYGWDSVFLKNWLLSDEYFVEKKNLKNVPLYDD